ncbi:MAG: DUF3795 domain-containing protein [Candidatus Lokiarchaeota archaeon]|nr:DUF3795 domain-containing protein [Candidatus Lokiarchaeota archaeon]
MKVMPCGIYCPGCKGCRKCKTIFHCAKDRGINYCYECKFSYVDFPCKRFQQFAEPWKKYGQDLIANQQYIAQNGHDAFKKKMMKEVGK